MKAKPNVFGCIVILLVMVTSSFAGDIGAQCENYYLTGDFSNAFVACQQAAVKGHPKSLSNFGDLYLKGWGVGQSDTEAFKWFKKAAEKGDANAQFNLATFYDHGRVVPINPAEAVKWYQKAALKGHIASQVNLGLHYQNGEGVKQNYSEAVKWFKKAAEKGSMGAANQLGLMYSAGKGVKKDDVEAVKWLNIAASQGFPAAQHNLANAYFFGEGVKKDYAEAYRLFRLASEQGHADSQRMIGGMFSNGLGVPENFSEAAVWFHKAAEQGNIDAQRSLGFAYAAGEGVEKDITQSLAWLFLASAKGDDLAERKCKLLKENVNKQQILEAQQLAAKIQNMIDNPIVVKPLQVKAPLPESLSPKYSKLLPKLNRIFTPNDIAVIIGIERYRSVPKTDHAANDAKTVRDFLKGLGFADRNIEYLTDDAASLSDIRKVVETKLPNMVKPGSRVFFYYAGHGAPDAKSGESYLVPFDGDPSYLQDTAYPLNRLYEKLGKLPAKEVLVILDSCFSGSGGRSVIAQGTRPLVRVEETSAVPKNLVVLTSARGSQITTSIQELGHGVFTYFFLKAIQDGKRDIGEVYAYLKPLVEDEAKRQNVEQSPTITPNLDTLTGRFVLR